MGTALEGSMMSLRPGRGGRGQTLSRKKSIAGEERMRGMKVLTLPDELHRSGGGDVVRSQHFVYLRLSERAKASTRALCYPQPEKSRISRSSSP